MGTSWANLTERARGIWEAQNRTNRMIAISAASVVGIALVIFGAMYGLRRPDYTVLFSNLSAQDASAVIAKLKDEKVDFQLRDGGTTVLVPSENVYEERVALAGAGVVKEGGVGFEIFDRTNLGMTDFQERIAKTRAIEGELQRTIDGLTPVEAAKVNIAVPEQQLYTSQAAPSTASVAIKTKPGMSLSTSEITGITMLVARAVEGLKPEDVTIVDANGNVLLPQQTLGQDGQSQASALQLTEDQLVAKQRYEQSLQQNIQSMLDATLGPHKSAVRVATDMSFDVNQTDSKTYAPQGTVRSEQTEREQYQGSSNGQPAAAGVPGTTTNVVPTYQGTQQQGNGRYSKQKATRNYEITEQDTKHVDAPGRVTRTSVAVLVNVPAAAANAAAGPNGAYSIAPADVAKIRNVVAAAAGIDPTRGDQVSVEAIPFNPAVAVEIGNLQGPSTIFGIPVIPLAAFAIIALLGGVGAGVFYLRRRGAGAPMEVPMPAFDTALTEELPPLESHPMLETAPGIAAPVRSASDITREQMVNYVTSVAQENPDSIAKLLKLWLAE
jgi:flagellar M-ring protein FliF